MNCCETCQYKQLNVNHEMGHCYMFKTEPTHCMQWKGNVGTVGHVGSNKAGLAAAILASFCNDLNELDDLLK